MKIIITAGGTSEKIDNVRKITNSGTGKLGCTIANKLIEIANKEVDEIYYICSKNSYKPDNPKIKIIEIFDTQELKTKVTEILLKNQIDYFIHSMAVSDYTVDYVTNAKRLATSIEKNSKKNVYQLICENKDNIKESKISSDQEDLIIKLKRTPKIIGLVKQISPKTHLIGFKLLDNVSKQRLIEVASKLRDKNNCDLVVANDLNNIRQGNHKAYIVKENKEYINASGKEDIAIKLIREMLKDD